MLSISTSLALDLSFSLHIIVSLPYISTGTSNYSFKILSHFSCKPIALTKDLLAPATLLSLSSFLWHSLISNWCSKHHKHFNSDTCSNWISSTQTSHSNPSSIQYNHLAPTCIEPSELLSYTTQQNIPHCPQIFLQLATKNQVQESYSSSPGILVLSFLSTFSSPFSMRPYTAFLMLSQLSALGGKIWSTHPLHALKPSSTSSIKPSVNVCTLSTKILHIFSQPHWTK